jgi:hypothetical protein
VRKFAVVLTSGVLVCLAADPGLAANQRVQIEKSKKADYFSDRLSGSFNTVPLGRTSTGFVTVKDTDKFEEDQKVKSFACTQGKEVCAKVKADESNLVKEEYNPKNDILGQ